MKRIDPEIALSHRCQNLDSSYFNCVDGMGTITTYKLLVVKFQYCYMFPIKYYIKISTYVDNA